VQFGSYLHYWALGVTELFAAITCSALDAASPLRDCRRFRLAPHATVLVMGFFVGMLGNLLARSGRIGGIEGAMIAPFVPFGQPASRESRSWSTGWSPYGGRPRSARRYRHFGAC